LQEPSYILKQEYLFVNAARLCFTVIAVF